MGHFLVQRSNFRGDGRPTSHRVGVRVSPERGDATHSAGRQVGRSVVTYVCRQAGADAVRYVGRYVGRKKETKGTN